MEGLGDVLKRVHVVRQPTGSVADPETDSSACPICHGAGYLRYDVSTDDPRFGQYVPCECTQRELEKKRLRMLIEKSNLGALHGLTFETFRHDKYGDGNDPPRTPERAWRAARRYAEELRGWFVLFGDLGTGKTHLAVAIANYRLACGEPAVFIVVPDLLDHLRSTFSPNSEVNYDEQFETVRNTPLLILDDLGTQTTTPWAQEKLYQILNHRYNMALPTVITTNSSIADIEPRLRSRIGNYEFSERCEIRGRDFRLGANHEAPTPYPASRPRSRAIREERLP